MAEARPNTSVDNDDVDYNDFFSDRTPEFDEARRMKQAAIDHCARQEDGFQEKKKELNKKKIELEQKCNEVLDANTKLLEELEEHVKKMTQLGMKKAELCKQQVDKTTAIAIAELTINGCKMDINALERELRQQNNLKSSLTIEHEQLEQKLSNIRDKEAENTNVQNYLQLSLKALHEQINRANEELRTNEEMLSVEMSKREECEHRMEELHREILEHEKEIQNIKREIEQLNEKKRCLELKQKDLQKQIEQMNNTIQQLGKMLEEKEKGLARLQEQVQAFQQTIIRLQRKVEELIESIRITNENLEKNQQLLVAAEERFNTLEATRKVLEENKRELEKTLRDFEYQRTDKVNELTRLQEKLRIAEGLFYQADANMKTLEQQQKQQSTEVTQLRNEQERLDRDLADFTNQTNELSELKDNALQRKQEAETKHQEAQQNWSRLKDLERQHKNEYDKAVNEEQRIQAQLQQAELEQRQAEEQVRAAEAQVKTAKILDVGWTLLGLIPVISVLCATQKHDLPRAEAALERARRTLEDKKRTCTELRNKHDEVKERAANCRIQWTQTSEDFKQQQITLQQNATTLTQCKMSAELLVEKYRNALRQQKQTELNLRPLTNKLQRTEAQLSTTTNDLQRYTQERASHESQRNELRSNVENLNTALQRHDEMVQEHRMIIDARRVEVDNVTREHQQQKITVIRLKGENENLKRSLGELVNNEKMTNREITHQQTLLEAEKKSVDDLRADIALKRQNIRDIERELVNTTAELDAVTTKIDDFVQEKTSLERNIVTKRITLAAVEKEHHVARSRVQGQDVIVEGLRRKMDQLNARDKQLSTDVQHLECKVKTKKEEVQKNRESIEQINQKIYDVQNRQEQSENMITESTEELVLTEQELRTTDEEIVNREQKFQKLSEKFRLSTKALADNEQLINRNYERLKNLEKSISDNRIQNCELKQKYEEKAIAIVKSEKEKWKNARIINKPTVPNEPVRQRK